MFITINFSSFSQGHLFYFQTQRKRIGRSKSTKNPTHWRRKILLYFSYVYLRCIQKKFLNKLYYIGSHICVCVFISFHHKGFWWPNKTVNVMPEVQVNDRMLRKYFCVEYLCRYIIDHHSRDLQAGNYSKESIKPGKAMRSKRQFF